MIGPIKTAAVYVENQEKALEFYRDVLGFTVRRVASMTSDDRWIEVSPPGAESSIVLYPRSMMPDWTERKPSIVFHCAEVEEECMRLESLGAQIPMRPTAMDFGVFATFADPDGNEFGLTSQLIAPLQGE